MTSKIVASPLRAFASRTLVLVLGFALVACSTPQIRTSQQTFCAQHNLGPNCERLVFRSVWWPDILIVNDSSGAPTIVCRGTPGGKLSVSAHVKNYGRSDGGPFWTQFDATYTERGAPGPDTKTYYVFSGWQASGSSSSGTSPFVTGGVIVAGGETDVVVTYDSLRTNLASSVSPGQNISAGDGPFTVRVRTNVPDPTNPSAPIANVNTSDKTVTCNA